MEERNLYNDISQRTNGDIYVGVVGPVRTGKIYLYQENFMDLVVLPNVEDASRRERAIDELPQIRLRAYHYDYRAENLFRSSQ